MIELKTEIKILFKLIKSFTVFFKKNVWQLFWLSILTIITISLILAVFISNNSLHYQESLMNKNSYPTHIPYYLNDKTNYTGQYPLIRNDYNANNFLGSYFPGLKFFYQKNVTVNNTTTKVSGFNEKLFKTTSYELYKLSSQEGSPLWRYNKNHQQKIPIQKDVDLYALAVSGTDSQNQKLQLLSNNSTALNNTFKINFGSQLNPDYMYCFLFNDIANYSALKASTDITTWNQFNFIPKLPNLKPKYKTLVSTIKQPVVLHCAVKNIDLFTKNKTLPDPYGNARSNYINQVWNTSIKPLYTGPIPEVNETIKTNAVNKYIALTRNIIYSWFGGGLTQQVTAFPYLTINNIQNLYTIYVFNNPNQPITYSRNYDGDSITTKMMMRPSIYQSDGKTFIKLSGNEAAISRNAANFIKNNQIGQKFQPFFEQNTPNAPPLEIKNNTAFNQISDLYRANPSNWSMFVSNIKFNQIISSTGAKTNTFFFGRSYLHDPLNFKINSNFMMGLWSTFKGGSFYNQRSLQGNLRNIENPYNVFDSPRRIHNRQIYINSIITIFALILLAGCLIIVVNVANKIIMQQREILGIMKANGLGNALITITFAMYFWLLTLVNLILGFVGAYLLSWGINQNFLIKANVYNVGVHFNFTTPLISIFTIPVVAFLLISFVVALNVRKSPLFLMNRQLIRNQSMKGWNLKFYFLIQKLGFQQKITIRLFSQSKLRLLFVIFVTAIASVVTYLAISTFNINTFIDGAVANFNTKYAYSLNTFSGIKNRGNYVDDSINEFSQWSQRLPNYQNFITLAEFNNNPSKYKQIIFYRTKSGQPDWSKIRQEIVESAITGYNFQNRWFKASSFVAIMDQLKDTIIPARDVNIYKILLNIYNQNKILINQLAKNQGIITIGFQILGAPNVTNGAMTTFITNVSYVNPQTFTSNSALEWIKSANHHTVTNPVIFPFQKSVKMFASGSQSLKQISQITLKTTDPQSKTAKILGTETNAQAAVYLTPSQKIIWNKINIAINEYNQNPIATLGKCIPLLIDMYSFKNADKINTLNPGSIMINRDWTVSLDLDNQQQKKKTTYLAVLASVGTTSNLFAYNYVPYMSSLKATYILNGFNPPASITQDDSKWKFYNTMYTNNDQNLLVHDLGIKEYNGAYSKTRYDELNNWFQQNRGISYKLNFQPWINGTITDSEILKAARQGLEIILWILQIVNIMVLCCMVLQILMVNNLIFASNMNIINTFRAMGYGRFWIFRRLFICYLPLIIISGIATFPVGFLASTFAFKQFSLIFRIFIPPVLSYFNFFFSVLIIFFIYLISFMISWYRFEKKHPPYKQIGIDN